MKKLLIYCNEEKIKAEKENATAIIGYIQDLINEASEIEIEINSSNLGKAISQPLKFAKDEIINSIDDNIEVAGKKVTNKAKYAEMFMPDLSGYEKAAVPFMTREFKPMLSRGLKYVIIVNGKAVLNTDELKTLKRNNSIYAKGDRQIELWNAMDATCKSFNSLNPILEKCGGGQIDGATSIAKFFKKNNDHVFEPLLAKFVDLISRINPGESIEIPEEEEIEV